MNQEQINTKFTELTSPLEKRSVRDVTQELAGRFMRHEMPDTIDELRNRVEALNVEGEELGFDEAQAYVDDEGQLVTIARRVGDVNGTEPQTKRCRISIGDHVMEVDLLPEWQGPEDLMYWRDGSSEDRIYSFNSYIADEYTGSIDDTGVVKGPSLEGLPKDMQMLIERYGKELTLYKNRDGSYASGINIYMPDVDISGSEAQFEPVRTDISLESIEKVIRTKAENEAYKIEGNAKKAAADVRKGLFMSARKHDALREGAYRAALDDQLPPRRR